MDEELLNKLNYILMNLKAERGGKDVKTALSEMTGEAVMPEWANALNTKAKRSVDEENLRALEQLFMEKQRNKNVFGSEIPFDDPSVSAGMQIHNSSSGNLLGAQGQSLSPEEIAYYSNMGRKYRESENRSIDEWNDSPLGFFIPRVRK